MKIGLLGLLGFSFGALSAAGVFTVLAAVSLVPRFVGKTHTGSDVKLYENMIILGTIAGGLYSLYENRLRLWLAGAVGGLTGEMNELAGTVGGLTGGVNGLAGAVNGAMSAGEVISWLGFVPLVLTGIFCGMFVGCLALAIAEMLDSLPIFARRARLRRGAGILILSVAAGKLVGSLLYFWLERAGW